MERELKAYGDKIVKEEADTRGVTARELPVRGEVVRIISGALAGSEAMVEAVERGRPHGRTVVRLRIYGFPWPIEEPAYAMVRINHSAGPQRPHRWGPGKPRSGPLCSPLALSTPPRTRSGAPRASWRL